ncbi:MAG TPA: signal peptidase I [Nitrososphaerales archaeon]|nr:signal peptidase I [Nitrososphaerales archaeon]
MERFLAFPKSAIRSIRNKFSRRRVVLVFGASLLVLALALPLFAGTGTYPVAIVDGNSMYPTLHNGDLVFFAAPTGPIKNGTIIVFVQGRSGIPALDSLLMPVVIHRVVGMGTEPNGVQYFQTKGDNNLQKDPFVTDAGNVLGVPVLVIPYGGIPLVFLRTPYGLVALTSFVSLYYFSDIDTQLETEKDKERLLAVFAKMTLNREMSASEFERLRVAVEYSDEISTDLLKDPTSISLIDWLKSGGLSTSWKETRSLCPSCGSMATTVESGERAFLICPSCSSAQSR